MAASTATSIPGRTERPGPPTRCRSPQGRKVPLVMKKRMLVAFFAHVGAKQDRAAVGLPAGIEPAGKPHARLWARMPARAAPSLSLRLAPAGAWRPRRPHAPLTAAADRRDGSQGSPSAGSSALVRVAARAAIPGESRAPGSAALAGVPSGASALGDCASVGLVRTAPIRLPCGALRDGPPGHRCAGGVFAAPRRRPRPCPAHMPAGSGRGGRCGRPSRPPCFARRHPACSAS